MPKISVIVPVYNTERYLRRCIDSILAQTFSDFEVLLIDDGSTDGSGSICDEYAERDSRVRVFHKSNGGVSSARNLGLDNSVGGYVTFCDSDDYVLCDWLSNFMVNEHELYDIICQGSHTDKPLNEFGSCDYGFTFDGNAVNMSESLERNSLLGYLWIKLFRLDLIRKHNLRFDTSLRLKEDEVFVLQYLRFCNRCKAVAKAGYFYFKPDWDRKYNLQCREALALDLKMFSAYKALYPDSKTFSGKARKLSTDIGGLILTAFRVKEPDARNLLVNARKILGSHIWENNMNIITKSLIRLDKTGYFAAAFIKFRNSFL